MIKIYQGIDIVEISRIKKIIMRNRHFVNEVFTEREREYCLSAKSPHIHFAGRFAVKEACLKALGIGMAGGVDYAFQEIETLPGMSGKPVLSFSGWIEKVTRKRRIYQATVSISHCSNYAVASVILVGN